MIKVTYRQLNSDVFNKALAHLSTQSGYKSLEVAKAIGEMMKQFTAELEKARKMYMVLIADYAVKEDGKYKQAAEPTPLCPFELLPGKQEEFRAALDDFMNTEVELKTMPFSLSDLGSVQLTPMQMLALEPIFESSLETSHQPQEASAH